MRNPIGIKQKVRLDRLARKARQVQGAEVRIQIASIPEQPKLSCIYGYVKYPQNAPGGLEMLSPCIYTDSARARAVTFQQYLKQLAGNK